MLDQNLQKQIFSFIKEIPIFKTLGMSVPNMDEGYFEVRIPRKVKYDGIYKSLHGGILMTLADSSAAFAILTLTGVDQVMTTTDMNIRFLAPCFSDLTAKARVVKKGRTLCPCQVDLFDDKGVKVAFAQVTYMLLPGQLK